MAKLIYALPRLHGDDYERRLPEFAEKYDAIALTSTWPHHYKMAKDAGLTVFMVIDPGLVHWPRGQAEPTKFPQPLAHPVRWVGHRVRVDPDYATDEYVNGDQWRRLRPESAAAMWMYAIRFAEGNATPL